MSKSDEILNAELNAVTGTTASTELKQNVTLAEALKESGETMEDLKDKKGARKTRATKNDGDAPKVTTPRVKIAPGSTPSQVLAQHITDEGALHASAVLLIGDEPSADNFKAVAGTIDKLAKKIGEKAVNLMRNRNSPSNLQVYTKIAIDKLVKDGQLTSGDLTKHYQATKYSIGTARAQCNQLMTLLPALKLAVPGASKSILVLNDDSAILADLRKSK